MQTVEEYKVELSVHSNPTHNRRKTSLARQQRTAVERVFPVHCRIESSHEDEFVEVQELDSLTEEDFLE